MRKLKVPGDLARLGLREKLSAWGVYVPKKGRALALAAAAASSWQKGPWSLRRAGFVVKMHPQELDMKGERTLGSATPASYFGTPIG
jgi:hypothetical protein